MTTCLQTENDICEMTVNINITNCGGYYVYYMVKTPANSSYCVGKFTIEIFLSTYCLHCQSNMFKSVLHIFNRVGNSLWVLNDSFNNMSVAS
jgi:hypothetical protein